MRVAGDDMDEAIINHMKRTYNLTIGEQTAERIKIEIGMAAPVGEPMTMDVRGRDNISGLPRKTEVTSEEICEALQEPTQQIVEAVTPQPPMAMIGHVTSSYHSVTCGRSIALGLVADGRARIGETVSLPLADKTLTAEVTAPQFFDPEGARLDE